MKLYKIVILVFFSFILVKCKKQTNSVNIIERYIGQSKNMDKRVTSHFGSKGKLSTKTEVSQIKYSMKGSSKYERELYEQYQILKGGGINKGTNMSNLLNVKNPVGGRIDLNSPKGLEQFSKLVSEVIKKYNLPK